MSPTRYRELLHSSMGIPLPLQMPPVDLAPREFRAGWHFCDDWDGLLIGPWDEEISFCHCYLTRRARVKRFVTRVVCNLRYRLRGMKCRAEDLEF